jgi:hypothetical protein
MMQEANLTKEQLIVLLRNVEDAFTAAMVGMELNQSTPMDGLMFIQKAMRENEYAKRRFIEAHKVSNVA